MLNAQNGIFMIFKAIECIEVFINVKISITILYYKQTFISTKIIIKIMMLGVQNGANMFK